MKFEICAVQLLVSYPAVAFLSVAIICDRKGTVLLCLLSSLFHEIGHLIMMRYKGAKLKSVCINLGDVAINADCSTLSYTSEILVTISGVAVNFVLSIVSFIVWRISGISICKDLFASNLCIGVFNMLPVKFLDGGQLLGFLLKKRLSPKACDRILNILTIIILVPMGILSFVFIFNSSYNYSLLFAMIYLICTLVSKEFKNVS